MRMTYAHDLCAWLPGGRWVLAAGGGVGGSEMGKAVLL